MLNEVLTRKPSPELIKVIQSEIKMLMTTVSGVVSVVVASTDGFELANAHNQDSFDGGKYAAVSSTIMSLVGAFLTEIHLVGCQSITLDAENGKALITSIPVNNLPMVMVVTCNNGMLLGHLLHAIRGCIANVLSFEMKNNLLF